jgi:hypothetical protein
MGSINQLAKMAIDSVGKIQNIKHIPGLLTVYGINSYKNLIHEKLDWKPTWPLQKGMEVTYKLECKIC